MSSEQIARKPRITGKAFRLKKSTKRMLALQSFVDADQRAAFRRAMIEAQVAESVVVKARDKNERPGRTPAAQA
jgi:hypothetical protein